MAKVQAVSSNETFEYQIGDSTFVLCPVPAEEVTRMLDKYTRRRAGRPDVVDSLSFSRWYRDRAIQGWRDVVIKENGIEQDFPCTTEHKMQLPNEVWREIQDVIEAANRDQLQQKEISLGN